MEKIDWTDRVRNEEVLPRVEEERNILRTIKRRTALLVGRSRDRFPVTGDFFRGIRQFHVPWGRLSL